MEPRKLDRLAHKRLEASDGVDGAPLGVHVDGAGRKAVQEVGIRTETLLVVGVRRELEGIARVGQEPPVVHSTDRDV